MPLKHPPRLGRSLLLLALLLQWARCSAALFSRIDGLSLVDASSGRVLRKVNSNNPIPLTDLSDAVKLQVDLTFLGRLSGRSAVLDYEFVSDATSQSTTSTSKPFAMSNSAATEVGDHILTVTVRDWFGRTVEERTFWWSTIEDDDLTGSLSDQVFTGFTLINAATNKPIALIQNGDLIEISGSDAKLNVRANVRQLVSSVTFQFQAETHREEVYPYSMAGDVDGDYLAADWLSIPGSKSIVATATLEDGGRQQRQIQFQIETDDNSSNPTPPVTVGPPVTPPTHAPFTEAPNSTPASSSDVVVTGELRQWHKVTLSFLNGPETTETDSVNPFTDYRLDCVFSNGQQQYVVPGYFAADGNAANTGASSGSIWRCHFSPPAKGAWTWVAKFVTGADVAMDFPGQVGGTPIDLDGLTGSFNVIRSNKSGPDLRGKGLLQYVGKHHLQFAGNGEYFLKAGADSPENFLAYDEFDNTPDFGGRRKSWEPHVQDFSNGPSWQGGKGKGIIGAVNYLADMGMNVFSFLTMNIEGDDRNVFPYISDSDFLRIDVSKTAQWEIVFEHADEKGMFLHFKTQETENDQLLDGGALGRERKLYYRELVARFSHHLALNWNIGEENTNTDQQRNDFAEFMKALDPYNHPVVVHTYPGDKVEVYTPLYGNTHYDGASLQSQPNLIFSETLDSVRKSAAAGRPWVVANDEQGNAQTGIMPDSDDFDHDLARKQVLWGNIMAQGAGIESYFGYGFSESDLTCNDFRSRENWWKQAAHALSFFSESSVPFQDMVNDNSRVSNGNWCLIEKFTGTMIVLYLPEGGSPFVDLNGIGSNSGNMSVRWYNPRTGGSLQTGSISSLQLGFTQSIGDAPSDVNSDWVVLLKCVRGCL